MMKYDINTISATPRKYDIDDFSWLPDDEPVRVLSSSAQITLFRKSELAVQVDGKLTIETELACDRCGELFQRNIENQFTYVVKNEVDTSLQEQEHELLDEEINTVYLQESTIDISEMLREQFYLTIPESRMCKQDCMGLCLSCGAPLTSESCSCQPDMSGSPFAVLQKLKK